MNDLSAHAHKTENEQDAITILTRAKKVNEKSLLTKRNYTQSNKHHSWKGYQEIPLTYFAHVKQGAVKRKLIFCLTIEYAWQVFIKQKRKCALSGADLKFNSRCRVRDGNASLDRIDSTKGYVVGNVQWVHKLVNVMKQDMTDAEFIGWCNQITNFKRASV